MQRQQPRPVAKRSACDRCREHKLRCLRSQGQDDGTCVRCARAGASCVTGAPKPLGRPRISSNDTRQDQKTRRARHSLFVSATVPRTLPEVSPTLVQEPEHEIATEPAQEPASPLTRGSRGFETSHIPLTVGSETCSMFLNDELFGSGETPDAAVDVLDFEFPDDALAISDLVGGPNPGAYNVGLDFQMLPDVEPPASKSLPAVPVANTLGFCNDPAFQFQSLPSSALDVPRRLLEPSLDSSNVLIRLARLNEGIAHQLAQVASYVSSSPAAPILSHMNSCVGKVGDSQINPILRPLESTSELAAIVKEIISPIQDHSSSPLSTPIVLMCLSSYIQLLQIYDTIFSHVHRFLSGVHDVPSFFEKLPGFTHLPGLPPIKGDLYVKIMVQVAQHNISNVERVIGLPSEMSLSAQRTSPKSLLGHVDSPDSFQRIMDQACNSSETSGRALVASLRINIGNVLGLLRDEG